MFFRYNRMIGLWVGVCIGIAAVSAQSATVEVKGERLNGRVIARLFDTIVVTVITPEKRFFQFTAADIELISVTEALLVSVNTFLREDPSNTAEPVVALTRGLEVSVMESPEESDWIKVQIWGNQEGWMIRDLLSKKVVYTPEEKSLSASKPNPNSSHRPIKPPDKPSSNRG